jgi:hypothetical protein
MRPRSRRRNLVVWSSSAGPAVRQGTRACTRTTRIRRQARTCTLLALIGLINLARAVRARRLLMAGVVLTVAGIALPGGLVFIAGMLVLLRGVAVTLGVSEPRRRLGGEPADQADFFGLVPDLTRALPVRSGRRAS